MFQSSVLYDCAKISLILFWTTFSSSVDAFSPLHHFSKRCVRSSPTNGQVHWKSFNSWETTQKTATTLFSSSEKDDSSSNPSENYFDGQQWVLPNDFRTFLNQCSIQSFMFLVASMRDPETTLWMEQFTKPAIAPSQFDIFDERNYESGSYEESSAAVDDNEQEEEQSTQKQRPPTITMLRYHGLAAIDTEYFPTWDTYFKKMLQEEKEVYEVESGKAHIPDYTMEIDPASLCSRLLSVRNQIANEWKYDLGVIARMGGWTLESYWDNLKSQQRSRDDSSAADQENNKRDGTTGPPRGGSGKRGIDRQNLLFLEWDPNFDSDIRPSPLRKGNFDLLTLYTTQEAIHRVLNDKERQKNGPEQLSNAFLRNFYEQRIGSYFTGLQRYGRADDFLEELLLSTPSMVQVDEGVTGLIDPTHIASLILNKREQVATEWQEIAEISPTEHMEIQKAMLNRMMGKTEITQEEKSFE
mmetsp:Transcript_27975/g.39398  ORF Transcript_27975/g.39398 Transcript_27975/m.39398 type:complete len:469 (-) Transcript_27975:45-1451(-)